MKSFQFLVLFLWEFVTVIVANGPENFDPEPPKSVTISIKIRGHTKVYNLANLKLLLDSYVANENLPVWIVHTDDPHILVPLSQVMDDIGPFSMYHDVNKCTAAVYFHKRQQFEGTIKSNILLHKADYDLQSKQLKVSPNNIIESTAPVHPATTSIPEDPTGVYEEEEQKTVRDERKYIKSRLPYPKTVYIETLVFVNYDLAEKFGYDYASIVSHILVTFNTVDMLYSRAEVPKIKINIAGIIIGKERESFPQLIEKNCYQQYNGDIEGIHARCILRAIRSTLNDYYDTITVHSYDVVIFLTNIHLIGEVWDENEEIKMSQIGGESTMPGVEDDETYDGYQSSPSHVKVAAVYAHDNDYNCFHLVAHEMAHLLNAFHDQGEFRSVDGVCTGNIMRTAGDGCGRCLYFSSNTLQQFTHFFSSRDGCIFHNEPKSLYDPISRPRLFWSQDEQCRCYGYEYAYRPQKRGFCFNCIHKEKKNIDCKTQLKCVRHENSVTLVDDTTYLMDGTPCERNNKICWNWNCIPIVN